MTVEDYNKAVDRYADNLYRFILKNLKDEHMSRDIVQDVYEKLWMRIEDVSAGKVKSYLFTSGYHTMIDYLRKERRLTGMEPNSENHLYHQEQYSDLREILEEGVNRLPDDQRAVLMLRDYEGYAYKEISEITGLSETQVKVYIYRARIYLKSFIGSMERVI